MFLRVGSCCWLTWHAWYGFNDSRYRFLFLSFYSIGIHPKIQILNTSSFPMTDNHLLHFLYSRITFSSHPILFHHLIIPSSHPLFQPVVIKKKSQNPSFIPLLFHSEQCICLQHKKQPNPFSFFPFYFLLFIHASALFPHCFSVPFFSSFSLLFSLPILLSTFFIFFFYFLLILFLSVCLSYFLRVLSPSFPPPHMHALVRTNT